MQEKIFYLLSQHIKNRLTNKVPSSEKNFKKSECGQGMTEYLIIVALIAVSAFGVYRFLGTTISNKTAAIALSIAEQDSSASQDAAAAAAKNAAAAAKKSGATSSPVTP